MLCLKTRFKYGDNLVGCIEDDLLKYSLLTFNLMNRSGVSHDEKNGNPYEVLHDPFLVKYKTFMMHIVLNTIRFIPKCGRLELGKSCYKIGLLREHKEKCLGCSCQGSCVDSKRSPRNGLHCWRVAGRSSFRYKN